VIGPELAKEIVTVWLTTGFDPKVQARITGEKDRQH